MRSASVVGRPVTIGEPQDDSELIERVRRGVAPRAMTRIPAAIAPATATLSAATPGASALKIAYD